MHLEIDALLLVLTHQVPPLMEMSEVTCSQMEQCVSFINIHYSDYSHLNALQLV